MSTIHVDTVVQKDGELHLHNLPCRKGDRVQATVIVPDTDGVERRNAARQRFLESARKSTFRSTGPYPSRDELHDRD